jgi:hypothetical protein
MQKKQFPWRILLVFAGLLPIEYLIFKYFYREYDITLGFDRLASVVFILFLLFAFDCIIAGCVLIPNTAKKYKLKRVLAISIGSVALTAGATVLMCNYVPPEGSVLSTPSYAQIESLTVQEMENGVAVSGEVSLTKLVDVWRQENPDRTYFGTKYFEKTKPNRTVEGQEKSFFYRFRLKDGTERDFSIFSDDKFDYIEELGSGLWRYERGKNIASNYIDSHTTYLLEAYNQAFGQHVSERKFSIMPGYNGAGKVLILNTENGEIKEWSTFPEELAAARAEDVRYLLLVDEEKLKTGYWVSVETGETVGDAYDTFHSSVIYDLLTGETTVFEDATDDSSGMWDKIGAFLEKLK